MRKKFLACLGLALTMALAGCGSKAEETTIDAKALAADLVEKVAYTDELNEIDSDMAKALYQIDTAKESYVYVSSGATAEEVAVFEFEDAGDAADAVEAANTRIREQRDSFATYIPEEVDKLEHAFVRQSGCYLVVCITDDRDNANEVLNHYLK